MPESDLSFPYYFLGHGYCYDQYYITIVFQSEVKVEERPSIESSVPLPLSHQILWHPYGLTAYGFDDYTYPINYASISSKYFLNLGFRSRYEKEVHIILSTLEFARQVEDDQMDLITYEHLLEKALGVPENLSLYDDSRINGKSLTALNHEAEELGFYSFEALSDTEHRSLKKALVEWTGKLHESFPIFLALAPLNDEAEPKPQETAWDKWNKRYLENKIKPGVKIRLESYLDDLDELTLALLSGLIT
ncbi:MAG: hypothetical protein AAF934_01165 [Bacteroidota bacterium]